MRRDKWAPTKYSRICSRHFSEDSYRTDRSDLERRILKKDAVPSIFNFPSHSQKQIRKRSLPKKYMSDHVM